MPESLKHCLLCDDIRLLQDKHAIYKLNLHSTHGVSICKNCGVRFLNPRPTSEEYRQLYTKNSGLLVDIYSNIHKTYEVEAKPRTAQYQYKIRELAQLTRGKKLLEIGSYTGAFLNEAKQSGFIVDGIEASAINCKIAFDQYGIELKKGFVEDYDYSENSFDLIFCSHIFEHLLDPLEIAKKLFKWLRPGGFLIIEVPNQFESFAARRQRWFRYELRGERTCLSIHHTIFFSSKTLKKITLRAGFHSCSIRNIYYYIPIKKWAYPIRYVTRILNLLLGGSGVIEAVARK